MSTDDAGLTAEKAQAGDFKSPCPAGDCDRTTPCRPPAPECPHPWHAATKAHIAARFAALRNPAGGSDD